MRQGNKYSDLFRSRCGTTSVVLAGGRALGRHTTYSHVHTRTATSLNEHLRGRCGVGVVVIKYETKNDFLYSKHLAGVFQHRLRSPRTYSEGWCISRGRSDSYHLNGSGPLWRRGQKSIAFNHARPHPTYKHRPSTTNRTVCVTVAMIWLA